MRDQAPNEPVTDHAGSLDERPFDHGDDVVDRRLDSASGPGRATGQVRGTEMRPVLRRWRAPDGAGLAYRQLGEGRPLILMPGFSGSQEWIEHGLAAAFAAVGRQVIMPDLRGHGASDRQHQASAYPPDVLASDGLALVSELGLRDSDAGYDLLGYSLGGRVVLRMLVRGARPARAVVAGQGLDATSAASDRTTRRRRLLTAMVDGTPLEPGERVLADWMTQRGVDPRALLLVLDSFVATPPEALARISSPTLVVVGERDPRAGADTLAAAIPGARFTRVPGDHDALTRPQLLTTILAFLDGPG